MEERGNPEEGLGHGQRARPVGGGGAERPAGDPLARDAEPDLAVRALQAAPSASALVAGPPDWARRGADWSTVLLAALVLLAGVMAFRAVRWLALRGPLDDLELAQRGREQPRSVTLSRPSKGSGVLLREPSPRGLVQAVERLGEPTCRPWALASGLVEQLAADPSRLDALAPSLLAVYCAGSVQARDEAGFVLVEAGRRFGWRPPLAYHGPLLATLGDPDPRVSDRAIQLVLHLGPAFQASATAFADAPETTEAARSAARRALARVAEGSNRR